MYCSKMCAWSISGLPICAFERFTLRKLVELVRQLDLVNHDLAQFDGQSSQSSGRNQRADERRPDLQQDASGLGQDLTRAKVILCRAGVISVQRSAPPPVSSSSTSRHGKKGFTDARLGIAVAGRGDQLLVLRLGAPGKLMQQARFCRCPARRTRSKPVPDRPQHGPEMHPASPAHVRARQIPDRSSATETPFSPHPLCLCCTKQVRRG